MPARTCRAGPCASNSEEWIVPRQESEDQIAACFWFTACKGSDDVHVLKNCGISMIAARDRRAARTVLIWFPTALP